MSEVKQNLKSSPQPTNLLAGVRVETGPAQIATAVYDTHPETTTPPTTSDPTGVRSEW